MNEERRICPRFLYTEPVSYGDPQVTVNGSVASNISLSGIALKVQGFVPVGAIVELQLRLGQSPKVTWVKAQVVRMREVSPEGCFEIGLKFVQGENSVKDVSAFISACQS